MQRLTFDFVELMILATMLDDKIEESYEEESGKDFKDSMLYYLFLYKNDDLPVSKRVFLLLSEFEEEVEASEGWCGSDEVRDILYKEFDIDIDELEKASQTLVYWRDKIAKQDASRSFLPIWKAAVKWWEEENTGQEEEIKALKEIIVQIEKLYGVKKKEVV